MNSLRRAFTVTALVILAFPFLRAAELPKPLLLVLDKSGGKLVLVDPVARKVIGQVATGVGPHEVAVSADGKTAFVANYGDQTPGQSLSVIDLEARRELRRVDLGAMRQSSRHGAKQRQDLLHGGSQQDCRPL